MEKMKKALMILLRYRRLILPILIIAIIFILLSAFIYFITIDDGTYKSGDKSNVPYVASTYTTSVKFTEEGIKFVHVDEETGTEVEMTSSEKAQLLWDEMLLEETSVKDYLDSVEELQRLMNAEIITQYPKIGVTGEDKLDGTIEFKRHKTDGTSVMLKYVNKETFDTYINNKDRNAINYYTLDENGNALIAVIDETTETLIYNDSEASVSDYTETLSDQDYVSEGNYNKYDYTVYSKAINYKNAVNKYTLPFQYLWSFIVIGEDKGVGLELAELAKNSQIIISIYDKITTTDNNSNYTYKRGRKVEGEFKLEAETTYGISNNYFDMDPPVEWEDEGEYSVNHTIQYKSNTPVVDITKADVWCVDYSKEYTYKPTEETENETNEVDLDGTEYVDDGENPVISESDGSDLPYYDKFSEEIENLKNEYEDELRQIMGQFIVNNISVTHCEVNYYKKNTNIHQVNVSITSAQDYVAQAPISNPKIQKKTKQEYLSGTGKDNFVTILCDPEHSRAKYNITQSVTSWLFELLESNPDTVNMIDLTKYFLYVVTGDERFGVTEYDFGVYDSISFMDSTGAIYGDSIQEKVWFTLKDLGYSDIAAAGAMGNIHYESRTFNPVAVEDGYTETTGGIGICQWTNDQRGPTGRNTDLRTFAASRNTTWQDEDIQVEFLRGELTIGGGADNFAKYQLMSTKSFYGSELACASGWKDAQTVEDATKAFCYSFERPTKKDAQSSMETRILHAEQYYNMYSGMEPPQNITTNLTGDNKSKMQSMISQAVRIANDDSYKYSQTYRESEKYYDCSSFVSRLYTQFFGISRLDSGTAGRGTDNIRANCKSKYMQVSLNSLQPGDILWRDGHVALYIGNNQTAEAASTSSGILVRTMGRFSEAYRVIY